MARAVMSQGPQDAFDWAGIVALLGLLGGAAAWLWERIAGAVTRDARREVERDRRIEDREESYIAKVETRLVAIEGELKALKRDYGLVVGIAHVMVDDLILLNPRSAALAVVAVKIRETYPLQTDTPSEMLHLLSRLDAAKAKGGRP